MATKRITAELVNKLKPGDQVFDTEVRGFGVRCRVRDTSYFLKTRIDGRQALMTIGRHGRGYWGPESARREAERLLGLIRAGKDPVAEKRAEKAAVTFADFAERYMAEYAELHKKPRTVTEDRRNLALHVLPAIGGIRLPSITKQDIAKLHHAMREKPVAANRVLALISSILGWAERIGERADGTNPCRNITKYKEKPRERYLDKDEITRLGDAIAAAEATGAADWRAITAIRLYLLTGARKSEILTLRWDWIDFEAGVARLGDSKTGAKNLFLPAPALDILTRIPRLEGNPYVIPGDRPAAPFVGLWKIWNRIRDAAGLGDVRIHDLRHSFASAAIGGGDSLFIVGKLLGHKKSVTTERYAHLAADPAQAAADRTGNRIAALMKGAAAAEVIEMHATGRRKPKAG